MKKLIGGLLAVSLTVSSAKALDGEIIFRDSMYGAGVGALAGGALYLIDSDDFASKIGTGVIVGLIVGFGIGVFESQTSLVEIKNGKIHAGIPQINIKQERSKTEGNNTFTEVSLLGVRF